MLVTLLLLAKVTEVTVISFCTQLLGISPVFVEPTWIPEELKALEVVINPPPDTLCLEIFLFSGSGQVIEYRGMIRL